MAKVPSVGKHKVQYVIMAGYSIVMEEVALDGDGNDEKMVPCLEYSDVIRMVSRRVLTIRKE